MRFLDNFYELANLFGKRVCSINIRTLLLVTTAVAWTYYGKVLLLNKSEKVIEPYVKNQWRNFYLATGPFESRDVRLILFDVEILPHAFKPRREYWHDPAYTCQVLCKHHPDGNNLITFAVLAHKFISAKDELVSGLRKVGFAVHLSKAKDPLLPDGGAKIPTYLWLARNDHVIHITILYDRHGDFYWAGPVTDADWSETVRALKRQMTIDWRTLNGAVFPRHAQAYEKSHHLTGVLTKIDSHEFVVPYNIKGFLEEYQHARFVECDIKRARRFRLAHPSEVIGPQNIASRSRVREVLAIVKKVLTKLKIPFWLNDSTLLGWYRQCDLEFDSGIAVVSIAMWIHDFREHMIEAMENYGLMLKKIYGTVENSYEISFADANNINLYISFFYGGPHFPWNGRTRGRDGAKFKFHVPRFALCWTEYLEMKFRIPCETRSYVEATYGKEWNKPLKKWDWYSSPVNVMPDGYWDRVEWQNVMKLYETSNKEAQA